MAGAYARALLAVGQDRGEADAYGDELRSFAAQVLGDPAIRVFFESPRITRRDKRGALDRALRGKVSEPVLNLLFLLVDRGRQPLFGQIAESYQELYDAARGRVHARFTSAVPLAPAIASGLVAILSQKLGKEIIATSGTDEMLLGGMKIQIGDIVVDGTVRARLRVVQESMATQRLGGELFNEN
ncbi:MAG: ATP synthase F1 subunit delta [Planctomycetes bacterium]|nr:ATP synthase F1 subunit delta [Planctomycetota bacterium]